MLSILEEMGYQRIENSMESVYEITSRWRENFVVLIVSKPNEMNQRPWFVHLNLDACEDIRRKRVEQGKQLQKVDRQTFENVIANIRSAHINLINDYSDLNELRQAIIGLDLSNPSHVRPIWDEYFMTIANLAAKRSNCMKRKVGCVLVNNKTIVSTGYNGTPRGTVNCNEGGCRRCNSGSSRGTVLSTCFCLHAEENALLEAGRDRVQGSTLYCNTCPCITCSIKIVQSGVKEVVYSLEYSMDQETSRFLSESGVLIRKYIASSQV